MNCYPPVARQVDTSDRFERQPFIRRTSSDLLVSIEQKSKNRVGTVVATEVDAV